ncbi:hypothetical protein D9M69_538650 [compost metagenome]
MTLQLPDGITHQDLIEVSGLGDTVWVNAPDGSCIGRFSKRFGIDVHRTITDQMTGLDQCLFCTHEAAGPAEWEQFRAAMLKHYGIDVPANTVTFEEKA